MPSRTRLAASAVLGALAVTPLAGCSGGDGPTTPGAGAARVTVSPHGHAITVGQAYAFTAVAIDGGGRPVPAAPVAWRSSRPEVATVDGAGVATGRAAGHTMIVALLDGVPRDSAALAVSAPVGAPAHAPTPAPAPAPTPPGPAPAAPTPPAPAPDSTPAPLPAPPSPAPAPDARCGGVAQARTVDGQVAFRYSHGRSVEEGAYAYTFDDLAEMSFSLPRSTVGTHGVTWSGPVTSGSVRISHRVVDRSDGGSDTSTVRGEGQPVRRVGDEETSTASVSVDLSTCTYTLSASASVLASIDGEEELGPARVGSFTMHGIPLATTSRSAVLPVHSALWASTAAAGRSYFVGDMLVGTMFLRGHGNDVHGEGGAAVDFSIAPRR
jgi:hypothetical protein